MSFLPNGFLKAAHRPNDLHCYINPLPFIGLAIVLLCIFMLNTSPHHGNGVDLVKSFQSRLEPEARREDAVRITITRDGSVYFRNPKVKVEELPNRIRDATLNGAEEKIYLVVDARARYGNIKRILSQIQLAGIEKVGFLTEQPVVSR